MPTTPITRESTFRATPDELFDAFTVPSLVTQWLAQRADIDARPGGWWTFTWPPHKAARGRYITVDRPSRLIWTWTAEIENIGRAPEGGETELAIVRDLTLQSLPGGETRLVLKETGNTDEQQCADHARDIDIMLRHLHEFIDKGDRVDWRRIG